MDTKPITLSPGKIVSVVYKKDMTELSNDEFKALMKSISETSNEELMDECNKLMKKNGSPLRK